MKTAVVYRRVSTREQGEYGYSLQAQQTDITAYALAAGYQVVDDISDDESGMILNRPGLNRIRELLHAGRADVLIAHDSDRLSRNPVDYITLRDELARLGVELHYSQRGRVGIGTFGGDLVEDFYGRFAHEWRRKLLENTRNGKRTAAQSGRVIVAKRPPYGYRLDAGRLVIFEPEAVIVRLIFRLYVIDGNSISEIADELTRRNEPTFADLNIHTISGKKAPRGAWSRTSIRQIIKCETYAGVWYWGKQRYVKNEAGKRQQVYAPRDEWIAVEVPAIIDRATWEIAQQKLVINRQMSRRNQKHEYLLARRLTCGECGLPIYAHYQGKFAYYHCSRRKQDHPGPGECHLPYARIAVVDTVIWQSVKRLISDPDYFTRLANKSLAKQEAAQPARLDRLTGVRGKIEQKRRELDKLLRMFLESASDDRADFDRTRNELKAEIAELQQEESRLAREAADLDRKRSSILELNATLRDFQASLRHDDEPFAVRLGWVDSLDVRAVLEATPTGHLAHVTCTPLGLLQIDFDVPIDNSFAQRYNGNWYINLPLELGVNQT